MQYFQYLFVSLCDVAIAAHRKYTRQNKFLYIDFADHLLKITPLDETKDIHVYITMSTNDDMIFRVITFMGT